MVRDHCQIKQKRTILVECDDDTQGEHNFVLFSLIFLPWSSSTLVVLKL